MKNCFLILGFFISLTATAQPNSSYTGKAKTFVDKFWNLVDELKNSDNVNTGGKIPSYKIILDKAKVQLNYVKTKDPSYDVSSMEQALKPYDEGVTTSLQEKKDAFQSQIKHKDPIGDGLANLFMAPVTTEINGTGNSVTDIAKHKEQIQAYNGKVERVIASSPPEVPDVTDYIRTRIAPAKALIKKLETDINKAKDEGGLFYYRELIGVEVYWTAAIRIIKNVPEAAEVQQLAAAAIQRIGTEQQLTDKIAAKQRELFKNRKMPAAVKKDADLEQKFKIHFAKVLAGHEKYKDETIVKVNIVQSNWVIIRNQYTGVIVGRSISAAIATKKADGRYFVYDFANYVEDYEGGKYINGKCDQSFQWPQEILLENIK